MFSNIALGMKSYIGAQFIVAKTNVDKYDSLYIEIDGTRYDLVDVGDGRQYYELTVVAKEMGKEMDVVLYGVLGDKVYTGAVVENWSVRAKCLEMLDSYYPKYNTNATRKKQCDLIANMLAYGAEAQKTFVADVAETDLVTYNLPAEYAALIWTDMLELEGMPTLDESAAQIKFNNLALQLGTTIELNARFNLGAAGWSGYTAKLEYAGETIEKELTVHPSSAKYGYAVFNEILAADLREDISITLYHNDVAVSATKTFSIENRAAQLAAATPSYANLINAMMHFADAAHALYR